ncbi:B2 protein-like isoform X4 [Anoplophora glabripennis]|uniref:B2 protein-like isoform X4 n=1 Tax=Anoplophora glabripennis TaxID=217634 RepID=UPI00087546A2|nr:B2 protein-like isoform X4 [Anoplophora glabripennis]
MKPVIVFACVILGAWAQLPPEERQTLKKVHASCQSDLATRVEKEKLKNMDKYFNDIQVGAHMRCMATKLGFISEQGLMNREVVRSKIALVTPDESKVDVVMEKCAKQQKTPEKTAVLLSLCFYQNGVQYHHGI